MAENTFLGLQPYTEDDAYRFKGRTEESQELFRLIVRNDFTVCYAESGEGKTSLLNAGVFPLLRENMYFPIAITFTSDDYQATPDNFSIIIDRCIKDSITEYNEKNKGVNVEYRLCSTDFHGLDCQAELQRELSKYSWWKLRNYKPQAMGLTFTPVFVFDQFEEVFNMPGSIVWTKKFFDWLEDVSSDSCPDEIAEKIRAIIGTNAAFPIIKEEKDFKAVFSLRKEFIGELDYWGMQKYFIPSLKDNRFCLKALTYEGAKKVMTQQERFDEEKVEQILTHFVKQYSREPEKTIKEQLPIIPALLLSVVCDSWEKDISSFARLSSDEIGQSLNKIIEKFYDDTIEAVIKDLTHHKKDAITPESIRKDIDTAMFDLVDVNGKRVRVKAVTTLGTISMDSGKRFSETLPIVKYKKILNIHRIIKITKVDGEDYVEIVHDCLCPIIAKRREVRLAAEAKEREERLLHEQARKMRKRVLLFGLLATVFLGLMALFLWMQRENLTEREAKEEFKNQRDAVQKQKDEMVSLNESLNKQIQINQIQKDSLNEQLRINDEQKEELLRSLYRQRLLSQSLNEKNIELESSLRKIEQQQEIIRQKDLILDSLGHVNYASISPDGRNIVTTFGNDIKIWDAKTNKNIAILEGHTSSVMTVEYSPDARYILSCARDIRLWDAATGACKLIIKDAMGEVWKACFSPDGKNVVSASSDKTIRIWNLLDARCVLRLVGHTSDVFDVTYSPNGKYLASASFDHTVRIWDSSTGDQLQRLEGFNNGVTSVSFSPNGQLLAASSKNIQIWDVQTGRLIREMGVINGSAFSVQFHPNGKRVVSAVGKAIKEWDVETGKCLQSLEGHSGDILTVSYSPDGKNIISVSTDKTVRIWDAIR